MEQIMKLRLICVLILTMATAATLASEPTARHHGDEAKQAGLNVDVLAKLDAAMQLSVERREVSGIVGLIYRNGRRGYFESFGWLDIESQKPMPKDAIFRLKSMTKPVVTVAALVLLDEGKFTLDEPISKHLPEWKEPRVIDRGGLVPARHPITPRMLMTHSSGLYYQLPGKPAYSGMPPRDATTTLEEYSRALARQPLLFHPGEEYRYGTSIDVLGRYVEVVSGKPLDVYLRERLFQPLRMVDADFSVPESKQDRLAQLYQQLSVGKLAPALERFSPTRPAKLLMGGGGLVSTTIDYERFCAMLLNRGELDGKRVLKPETVDTMFQNHLKPKIGRKYGLGGAVDGEGGYSWGGANGTKFWIDRKNQLFAVFMVQTQNYRARTYPVFFELANEAAGSKLGIEELFSGKDLSAWKDPLGNWTVVGDVALDKTDPKSFTFQPGQGVTLSSSAGKSANLTSKTEHGDAEIHVEFTVPKNSNSGIYIQGRYELQILDSFGKAEIAEHDCGAIYQRWDPARGKGKEGYEGHAPKVNASKSPGEWQSFDITFRAPRFDAAGKKIENAKFIKVVHNGQTIHENVEVNAPTRGSIFADEAAAGPIVVQGDHGPVAFRSLKIVPINDGS
jgi:CubicO group peptidase (beta-lactamase class C family)